MSAPVRLAPDAFTRLMYLWAQAGQFCPVCFTVGQPLKLKVDMGSETWAEQTADFKCGHTIKVEGDLNAMLTKPETS